MRVTSRGGGRHAESGLADRPARSLPHGAACARAQERLVQYLGVEVLLLQCGAGTDPFAIHLLRQRLGAGRLLGHELQLLRMRHAAEVVHLADAVVVVVVLAAGHSSRLGIQGIGR